MSASVIEIYADSRSIGRCSGPNCGQKILWARTAKNDKSICFDDLDLVAVSTRSDEGGRVIERVSTASTHWATCPDRAAFRRLKPTTKEVERPPAIWRALQDALAAEGLNRDQIFTWFDRGSSELLADEGVVLRVAVRNQLVIDHIQRHFASPLRAALERVRPGVRLVWRVRKPETAIAS